MTAKPSPKRRDLNQLAHAILGIATHTSESETPNEDVIPIEKAKDPNAVALGRKGGLKGGKARASKLTKEERSASAKKAVEARWKAAKGKNEAASA